MFTAPHREKQWDGDGTSNVGGTRGERGRYGVDITDRVRNYAETGIPEGSVYDGNNVMQGITLRLIHVNPLGNEGLLQ